ncbi:MAG: hypothetical protein ACLUGQ_10285 [Coprococcus sp.]
MMSVSPTKMKFVIAEITPIGLQSAFVEGASDEEDSEEEACAVF